MDPTYQQPQPPPPPPPPAPTLQLSPRRELQLQGPRPSPLRVRKDSHKIKKPPLAPAPAAASLLPPLPPPPPPPLPLQREPVIIYTISPKIIHVDPSNFMDLVQRLTGPTAGDSAATPAASASGEVVSPAAKMATIHRTIQSPSASGSLVNALDHLDVDSRPAVDRLAVIPGILSPVPASLPPTSPVFFSPSSFDPGFLSFLQDLSPAGFHVARPSPAAAAAGSFFAGTGSFLSPIFLPSPGAAAWDLIVNFAHEHCCWFWNHR